MRKVLLILLFIVPAWGFAQSLSIRELWQHVADSYGQQQRTLDIALRRAELEELRQNRLPVVFGDVQLQRNLIIPTTPVPAIAFDPNAAEGAIIPLKFSTKWSSRAGVQAEWAIFDPRQRLLEEERTLQIRQAEIQQEADAQDWTRDATLAYTSVVLATHQYERARQDSAVYAGIATLVERRYAAGRESASSHWEAQQEMERKRIQLHDAWAVLLDADLQLRRYIDLSSTTLLSTDIQGILDHLRDYRKQSYTTQALEVDRQIAQIQSQRMKRELLPTLSLNGYVGGQYYSSEFRLDRHEEWYGNSFVNLVLRVPLSTYLTSRSGLRPTQLHIVQYDRQIEEEQRLDRIANRQQEVKVMSATEKVAGLRRIEEIAEANMEEQRKAYLAGRQLLSDYNRALLNYHKASLDVWQAQYDLVAVLLE